MPRAALQGVSDGPMGEGRRCFGSLPSSFHPFGCHGVALLVERSEYNRLPVIARAVEGNQTGNTAILTEAR